MASDAPAQNTTTAIEAWEPTEVNLDKFPTDRFVRLMPTQTLMQQSPYFRPVVAVVQLDVERDTYGSRDLPEGHRALNRVGLRKLATTAGVTFLDERRTDDGKDPDVVEISTVAEMVLPSGQRIRAPGTKRVRLSDQPMSDNQRRRYRATFQEHVASRAQHRAIRALLSLQQSYPAQELSKPFAVVTYVPDMSHPEVRERILDTIAPRAIEAAYGPEPKQVGAGAQPVIEAPQAADDDAVDADFIVAGVNEARTLTVQTNGHATVDPSTGEVVAESGGQPSWFFDDPGPAGQAASAEPQEPELIKRLRAAALQAGDRDKSPEMMQALRKVTTGISAEGLKAVLSHAWPGIEKGSDVSGGQAAAIQRVASDMGTDRFVREWQVLGERLGERS